MQTAEKTSRKVLGLGQLGALWSSLTILCRTGAQLNKDWGAQLISLTALINLSVSSYKQDLHNHTSDMAPNPISTTSPLNLPSSVRKRLFYRTTEIIVLDTRKLFHKKS